MKSIIKNIWELIRYSVIGGLTTIFNLAVFYFMNVIDINYLISNVLSYILAVILSYYLNAKFVFTDTKRIGRDSTMMRFFIVRVGALALDSLLLMICVTYLGIDIMISKVSISILIIGSTYLVNKLYVFNGEK